MAMFENSTITNAGKALIDSWVSGETLTFTSAVTGSGYTDQAELKDLTVLPDVKQTKSIAAQESTAQGEKLTVDVDVVGLAAGYQLKQIGIYAQKGSDTPVLFAVLEDVNGFYIPSETEMPDFVFEFFALLVMSVDGNVALTLDPTQLATIGMLPLKMTAKEDEENPSLYEISGATIAEAIQAVKSKRTVEIHTDKNRVFRVTEASDTGYIFAVCMEPPQDVTKTVRISVVRIYDDTISVSVQIKSVEV